MADLATVANIAAILTALVAGFGYGAYRFDRYRKRRKLEAYLKAEMARGTDKGQRSLLHLMARLGMTEAELLQASFQSAHIDRKVAADDKNGRASALLLEWKA